MLQCIWANTTIRDQFTNPESKGFAALRAFAHFLISMACLASFFEAPGWVVLLPFTLFAVGCILVVTAYAVDTIVNNKFKGDLKMVLLCGYLMMLPLLISLILLGLRWDGVLTDVAYGYLLLPGMIPVVLTTLGCVFAQVVSISKHE